VRRSPLKKKSESDTALVKDEIQSLLREGAILRDGGCILRHFYEAGACGGYSFDGELILQASHLNSRAHAVSFGDLRNIVCLCKHHHLYWKKQNPLPFAELVRRHIGEERWAIVQRFIADKKPYRMTLYDWKKIATGLRQELRQLQG
jgi:hypothetical protein